MAEIYIAAAHGAEGFCATSWSSGCTRTWRRSRDAVTQFIDEARLQAGLRALEHRPGVRLRRAGEEYFLALEYIHGRDLERLLRRHVETSAGRCRAPVAFYVMHEVLEALAYAHAQHRSGRASRWGSSTATSRPATCWSR